jgi:hypothetical protein
MTLWSLTRYHIQSVMSNMTCHGHAMYLPVLIKFLHFALKCYFISETIKSFWLMLYVKHSFSFYFYRCTVHFEDSLIITYQQMH